MRMGELDGARTPRVEAIPALLRRAGIRVRLEKNMDAPSMSIRHRGCSRRAYMVSWAPNRPGIFSTPAPRMTGADSRKE
jgi:hypothetical protein